MKSRKQMATRGRGGVKKRIPAGAVATSVKDHAGRLASTEGPSSFGTAAPASGPRPDPGPVPAITPNQPLDLRHSPLRFQFQYGINQVWTPRRLLTPFAILRNLADVSPEIRTCIETRKDQMCSLDWDIGPKGQKGKAKPNAKVDAARAFFAKPDQRRDFATWFREAIEEILVIDALSIYRRRTYDGSLFALEIKDGSTFLPLLDDGGDTPLPPDVAYRQIIYGQPAEGGDCTTDDLIYRPRTVRTWTPYGLSPTEAVLLTVNAALQRSMFNLQYYTDGNVPEGLLEAPGNWTPAQLLELQEYFDDFLTGDLGRRRRLKVVAQGTQLHEFKDPDFNTKYDEWLLMVICAAFAVPPQEIGFTANVNKATGEMQENVVYRRGVKPLAQFFKNLFDSILATDLGMPEFEWIWQGGEVEDQLQRAQVDEIYVNLGKVSVDELRSRDGEDPIGLKAYIKTSLGPVFVDELLREDEETKKNPPDVSNAPPDPAAPAPGGGLPPHGQEPGKKPPLNPPNTGKEPTAVTAAALSDLRKWRAVAIKAVKAGKPCRPFDSDAIPQVLETAIEQQLRTAQDPMAVVKAFDTGLAIFDAVEKANESRVLTKVERKASKQYKRLMADHFAAQGDALRAHLKKGLS